MVQGGWSQVDLGLICPSVQGKTEDIGIPGVLIWLMTIEGWSRSSLASPTVWDKQEWQGLSTNASWAEQITLLVV